MKRNASSHYHVVIFQLAMGTFKRVARELCLHSLRSWHSDKPVSPNACFNTQDSHTKLFNPGCTIFGWQAKPATLLV